MNASIESRTDLDSIIKMIGNMAALDFSSKIDIDHTNEDLTAVAQGLNWLAEELQANVVERTKLEEINANLEKFAYTAAHDMKSPLNSAIMLLNLIEKQLEGSNKEIIEYIKLLKETNKNTKKLINGILEYSKQTFENVEMHPVDLNVVCKNISTQYETNKQVSIIIDNKLPIVIHHETALIQIITNLLGNAVKFNDKRICLIEITCKEKPNHYELQIKDNGPGFNDEEHEKVFDLFENLRTKQEDSSGIGLAIVKKIVTETNGQIWIESNEKKGAKIVFTIEKKEQPSTKIKLQKKFGFFQNSF